MTAPKLSDWRSKFRVHPAAEKLPRMSEAELQVLSKDISENGLATPIDFREITLHGKRVREILDGRHRLDALELLGRDPPEKAFRKLKLDDAGAVLHIMSMNVHRRHLSPEQKRQVMTELLKADPAQSDRQVAKIAKADHKTVAAQRDRMEATGELPQLEKRKGADGKTRKAKPASPESKSATGDQHQPDGAHVIYLEDHDPNGGKPEPRPKETYPAPLRRKPKLDTYVGVDAARNFHVARAIAEGVDVEEEIELFAAALRAAATGAVVDHETTIEPLTTAHQDVNE
jgi:hypothetical protein